MEKENVEKKKESSFHIWKRKVVKEYNILIIVSTFLLCFAAILFVLIRSIYFPGYAYCDPSCNEIPTIPDAAAITIVVIIFLYSLFWIGLIATSSGSWMDHAYFKKVVVLTLLYLIIFSFIQLIAPATRRQRVYPYSHVSNYQMQVVGTSESTILSVTNFWNQDSIDLFKKNKYSYVSVIGYKVSEGVNDPKTLPTNSEIVYREEKITQTTPVDLNTNFTRQITTKLEQNGFYFWLVFPASKSVGNNIFREHPIVTEFDSDGSIVKNEAIDLRGFLRCQWKNNICEQ